MFQTRLADDGGKALNTLRTPQRSSHQCLSARLSLLWFTGRAPDTHLRE